MSDEEWPVAHRLVGRESQWEVAGALLDGLFAGRGGVLVVTGEPGIGKSRFAEEVVGAAASRGARVARVASWQDLGAPPLWPWREVLRQLTGSTAVLEQPVGESADGAEAARFRQFERVAAAIRDVTATAPVVAVLDDLQWADVASLRLFEFAASTLRDAPCLLVGACRPDELDGAEAAALAGLGTTIALGGLDQDAVHAVLTSAVGRAVTAEVAQAVGVRSGGNPLFVGELGRLMGAAGRTEVGAAAIPPAVGAVIGRRLARLNESVMSQLRAAAVVGKEFSASAVEAVLDVEADAVASALAAAVGSGVLVRTDRAAAGFAFAHDLIREVVLDATPPSLRSVLHLRAARDREAHLPADPTLHAVVAEHLEQAGGRHRQEAVAHWEAAGRLAQAMLSYEEAAAHYGRALRALTPDSARRADLLLAQADALVRAGELAAGRARYLDAADAARASGRADRLAAAALGIGAGVAGWEVPMWDQRHVELLDEALATLGADDLTLRSMLLARLSVAKARPESNEESRRLAEQALALAQRADDPSVIAQALAALCDALAGPEHVLARRQHAATIVEMAERAGERGLALLGRRFSVVALLELGDFPALDHEIALFAQQAALLRQPLLEWYTPLFRGMRALLRGDAGGAQRLLAEVQEAAGRTGSPNAVLLAVTLEFGIDVALGRAPALQAWESPDIDPALWASYAAFRGYASLLLDDRPTAAAMLRLHAEDGFARVDRNSEHLVTVTMFGRLAAGLGERNAAAALYELLLPHAGRWIVDGIAAVCWGPVDLELARLAAVLGDPAGAGRHLDAAAVAVRRAGAPLLEVEIQRLVMGLGRPRPTPSPPVSPRPEVNEWRREGQFWTLRYAGATVRVKDAKGVRDIAGLLGAPGREVHVTDLYGGPAPAGGDLGEVLDARARTAYRARIGELETEIAAAAAAHDRARAERARAERDFLVAELAAALGLGGRPRRSGEIHERARKAVTGRIRLTIERLAEPHPALARHLGNSIRTGVFCSYQPEHPTSWKL